jgi:hypothetical protein
MYNQVRPQLAFPGGLANGENAAEVSVPLTLYYRFETSL